MTTLNDRIAGVLVGLAAGDRIGGPLRMALCLSESLINQQNFLPDHIFQTYSKWYFAGGFDTGPTAARVFKLVDDGMSIEEAVLLVHTRANGMTAGCNPLHRAIVLALSPHIADDDLADIARQEARLTHYHPLAGDVSAFAVTLCRQLIRGNSIEAALDSIDTPEFLIKPKAIDGFAPHVLKRAIHFLKRHDTFASTLEATFKFAGAGNYCPVTVGAIAGAAYGEKQIAPHLFSRCNVITTVYEVAKQFTQQWDSKQ